MEQESNLSGSFVTHIKNLGMRTRQQVEEATVVAGSLPMNPRTLITILNQLLTSRIVWARRYGRHAGLAADAGAARLAERLRTDASEEWTCAGQIRRRIENLGGRPVTVAGGIPASVDHAGAEHRLLFALIKEDLAARRIGVETQRLVSSYLADHDSAMDREMQEMLTMEERQVDRLGRLLEKLAVANSTGGLQEEERQ